MYVCLSLHVYGTYNNFYINAQHDFMRQQLYTKYRIKNNIININVDRNQLTDNTMI
jgi:hypothetical protein